MSTSNAKIKLEEFLAGINASMQAMAQGITQVASMQAQQAQQIASLQASGSTGTRKQSAIFTYDQLTELGIVWEGENKTGKVLCAGSPVHSEEGTNLYRYFKCTEGGTYTEGASNYKMFVTLFGKLQPTNTFIQKTELEKYLSSAEGSK